MPRREVELKIKDWVSYVRGKIINVKRRPVYRHVPIEWMAAGDERMDDMTASIDQEEVMIIEIPVRELESMAETQDWFKHNIGGFSMDKFDNIIRSKYSEESLREKHPGLQEAWERYQIMLGLCSDETFN